MSEWNGNRLLCNQLRPSEKQPLQWIAFHFHELGSCSICCHFFSRFYQVRCWLRVTPRLSAVQIEASVLDNLNKESTSATVIRGAGTSKIFQILYRNEEVILKDTVLFRVRLPGNFLKLCFYFRFSFRGILRNEMYIYDLPSTFPRLKWSLAAIIYKIITFFLLCFVYFILVYSMCFFPSFFRRLPFFMSSNSVFFLRRLLHKHKPIHMNTSYTKLINITSTTSRRNETSNEIHTK